MDPANSPSPSTQTRCRLTRTRWAAVGATVAVALGGGALAWVGAADGGTASSFVPISPCRLLDTRSTSTVGPRSTPIGVGESLLVQVTGSNGACVVPSSATAIVINVTAVSPSAGSFLTLYPADVVLPNASNLNFSAGQSPAPNLVTVSLSAGGAIKIFNESGTVDVIGDIAGYYQPDAPGLGTPGVSCSVGGVSGVVVNGHDHEHNASSKCFTSMVTTLAGSGNVVLFDGVGVDASFNGPNSVAVDSVGNIYVADTYNNVIRKISVTGIVTTLAGSSVGNAGHLNATGSGALFDTPLGVAVDNIGNIYVADTANHRIRKISPAGVVEAFAGQATPGALDGTGAASQFSAPSGLAVDSDGNVYVADTGNHLIRKITPGGAVTTIAGQAGVAGLTEGTGLAAKFSSPSAIAVDDDGNLYVADTGNHRIRKIDTGTAVVTLAGSTVGFANGTGTGAQFNTPTGVAVDDLGRVFVADSANHRVRMVTAAGVVTTVAGQTSAGFADGIGSAAQFGDVVGVAVDGDGTLYVADGGHRIRRIQ